MRFRSLLLKCAKRLLSYPVWIGAYVKPVFSIARYVDYQFHRHECSSIKGAGF